MSLKSFIGRDNVKEITKSNIILQESPSKLLSPEKRTKPISKIIIEATPLKKVEIIGNALSLKGLAE
jgi:hypothetical protein